VREEAAKDLQKVRETYTPQNLVAGAEILAALSGEFRCGEPGRKTYFARNGHLGLDSGLRRGAHKVNADRAIPTSEPPVDPGGSRRRG